MKSLLIFLVTFSLLSCVNQSQNRGNYFFSNDSPFFYLSIAPSFRAPYEYELNSEFLVVREFDGLGGYDWGKAKEITSVKLSTEEITELRRLSIVAVKDSILEEEKGIDVIILDGTNWFLHSSSGFGPLLVASTNNPPDSFFKLKDYLEAIIETSK